jgi:hypothetical protein
MKQYLFSLKSGAEAISLPVFDDVESLYYWLTESANNENIFEEIKSVQFVNFYPGDEIIAEWNECEFDFSMNSNKAESYYHIRLLKISSSKIIKTVEGWVHNCILPFSNDWNFHNGIKKSALSKNKKLNLDSFFSAYK